nr:MAG TPA: hypothetical protein [Bacteriophage sp.]
MKKFFFAKAIILYIIDIQWFNNSLRAYAYHICKRGVFETI